MFVIVWLFTPQIRLKDTSSPIEVSTIKITSKKPLPRRMPSSIGTRIELPSARRYAPQKEQPSFFSDLTTAFNSETDLTLTSNDYVIAPHLELPTDYNSKSSNFSITSSSHGKSGATNRRSFGNVEGPERSQTWLDSLRQETGEAPEASIGEKDGSVIGHYNISLVKYEDIAEQFRNAAFGNLAGAMNRWTNVHTKVLPDSIPLDSKKIMKIPLIYIAARDAFAFSEKERANLHSYLNAGGTLLFSNIADENSVNIPVDNSIKFELWKILGGNTRFIDLAKDKSLCRSVFEFDQHPLHKKGRLYGVKLDGRIAVIYDVAGYGKIWAQEVKREDELKFGVNLLVYVLLNSPIVSHNRN